jgi:hypothetical protein
MCMQRLRPKHLCCQKAKISTWWFYGEDDWKYLRLEMERGKFTNNFGFFFHIHVMLFAKLCKEIEKYIQNHAQYFVCSKYIVIYSMGGTLPLRSVGIFLAHLRWKLKWALLIACCPSSVCQLLHFRLLQNHWANFNQTWHKSSLGEGGGDAKLFNEGDCPSQRGDNHKRVKIHWKFLKIFSGTSRPISIKLGTNHPWVKWILNCSNKGPGPLKTGDNHKNAKNGVGSFQNLLQNHWARIGHIYMKTFWYNVDSELFTSWSPGVGRGHNRENHNYICLWKKSSSPETAGQFQSSLVQIILG